MCRLTGCGGLSGNLSVDRLRTNGVCRGTRAYWRTDRDKQDGQVRNSLSFSVCLLDFVHVV